MPDAVVWRDCEQSITTNAVHLYWPETSDASLYLSSLDGVALPDFFGITSNDYALYLWNMEF